MSAKGPKVELSFPRDALREVTILLPPGEIDLDGIVDEARQVEYIGRAVETSPNVYRCLAIVRGALCWVECRISVSGGPS